nr:MAG TPA_asm: hypothetical protein [Caudoviricetes sp.]
MREYPARKPGIFCCNRPGLAAQPFCTQLSET